MIYLMAGQLGLPLSEVMTYTFRQLVVMYDGKTLMEWDQTVTLWHQLHTIAQVVTTWGSKKKPKIRSWGEIHPFRKDVAETKKIVTPENINALKQRMIG